MNRTIVLAAWLLAIGQVGLGTKAHAQLHVPTAPRMGGVVPVGPTVPLTPGVGLPSVGPSLPTVSLQPSLPGPLVSPSPVVSPVPGDHGDRGNGGETKESSAPDEDRGREPAREAGPGKVGVVPTDPPPPEAPAVAVPPPSTKDREHSVSWWWILLAIVLVIAWRQSRR